MHHEHRHPGAVLAGEEHLVGLELRRVEGDLGLAENGAGAGLDVVAVDGAGVGEAGEGVEGLAVLALAGEAADAAQAGQGDLAAHLAVEPEDLDLGVGVLEVLDDQAVVDDAHPFERLGRLRDHLPPALARRLPRVDRDDAAARRAVVGLEPEDRAFVAEEQVGGVEAVEQPGDRGVRHREVQEGDTVLDLGALPDVDHQVAAVLGDVALEAQLFLIGPLVDQAVGGLRRADAVVVELLVVVRLLHLLARFGLVVAAVEEALAVVGPGGARELDPLQPVGEVAAGRHLAHLPLLPVRATGGQAVGDAPAVLAHRVAGERDGAVGRQGVGIDQHARRAVQLLQGVDHALVLQAVVLGEEVAAALALGDAVALVVPELGQAAAQRLAGRDRLQVPEGDAVLLFDPGAGVVGVGVLQPAVGVGDLEAVVLVDVVAGARAGIGQPCRRRARRRRGRSGGRCGRQRGRRAPLSGLHGSRRGGGRRQ